MAMEDDDMIVVFTDDDGNEYYYREDLVIELEDKKFAVLVGITPEGKDSCGCGCDEDDCESEDDVYIARIEADENGEETYVDPSDEEFEMVREAYEEILAEEEGEEE